jgi:hypothetical protein
LFFFKKDIVDSENGEGRKVSFDSQNSPTISQVVERAKKLFDVPFLRVALGIKKNFQKIFKK